MTVRNKMSGGEATYKGYAKYLEELDGNKRPTWKSLSHDNKVAWQVAAQSAVRDLIGEEMLVTPDVLPGMPSNFAYDIPGEDDLDDDLVMDIEELCETLTGCSD